MLDSRIAFEERYNDEENETTTLYFIAPKELLNTFLPEENYPDAVSMEISIELPTRCLQNGFISAMEADCISVSISPTRECEGGTEDYDWHDVEIPYNEIMELISLSQ